MGTFLVWHILPTFRHLMSYTPHIHHTHTTQTHTHTHHTRHTHTHTHTRHTPHTHTHTHATHHTHTHATHTPHTHTHTRHTHHIHTHTHHTHTPHTRHTHTHTHTHTRKDFSGRVIGPSPGPVPDNTRHSQGKDIHYPDMFRTRNPSKRAAADSRHTLGVYLGPYSVPVF